MGEEVQVTIEDQFYAFARLNDSKRTGETITLYRSDYWMRQAHILDDRNVTMVDTGNLFFSKFSKTERNYKEWTEFVTDLCALKVLDEEGVLTRLTVCGMPGDTAVVVPEFHTYFNTWESKSETFCNATYDGFLCWPPTLSGELASQNCPKEHFSDPAQFAVRKCGEDGLWLGREPNETNPLGWTNYTPCFPPVVQFLFNQLRDGDAQYKFKIADNTRTIEIVGFTISLICLIVSLIILNKYESLRNLRTRIHKNLFSAMSFQVVTRLILYIDQAVARHNSDLENYTGTSAIESLPHFCTSLYVVLEYLVCVMFMWMLCEGIYLNMIVTSNVLRDNNPAYKYFCVMGWIAPLLITAAWATIAGIHYAQELSSSGCWYGYNFQNYFWVMQGPRLAVILINFVFLLKIMRVLVLKLREDKTSDLIKTRKAAKAALVLLPLLGITNVLSMFEGPVSGPVWHFATWSYITHSLRSLQGAFLAWLYCLGTEEVRVIIRLELNKRLTIFRHRHPQISSCLGITPRRPIQRYPRTNVPGDPPPPTMRPGDMQMRQLRHYRPQQQQDMERNVAETQMAEVTVELRPVDPSYRRQLRHFRPPPEFCHIARIIEDDIERNLFRTPEEEEYERNTPDCIPKEWRQLFESRRAKDSSLDLHLTDVIPLATFINNSAQQYAEFERNIPGTAVEEITVEKEEQLPPIIETPEQQPMEVERNVEKTILAEVTVEPPRETTVTFSDENITYEIPRDPSKADGPWRNT